MHIKPTPELVEAILKRVPEGFIHRSALVNRLRTSNKNLMKQASKVGRERDYFFDHTRVTREQVRERANWCRPALPGMEQDGTLSDAPISERIEARRARLSVDPALLQFIEHLDRTSGYVRLTDINPTDAPLSRHLVEQNELR
jgi:hypothetical protein